MGVKECRGRWGGEKREEKKIHNRIARLLKGKTTPSVLFFLIILLVIALKKKRGKRDHPHTHWIFYPFICKVQPITIVANKISRVWFTAVIAFLGAVSREYDRKGCSSPFASVNSNSPLPLTVGRGAGLQFSHPWSSGFSRVRLLMGNLGRHWSCV